MSCPYSSVSYFLCFSDIEEQWANKKKKKRKKSSERKGPKAPSLSQLFAIY